MKKVICLYRVSTVGQVDHDDIPMQRNACRDYAASHPDWEIIDEICEKASAATKSARMSVTPSWGSRSGPQPTSLMFCLSSCSNGCAVGMVKL